MAKEVSCGSSSDSDEGPIDRIPAPKSVSRSRSKPKPESVKVKTEKTPRSSRKTKTAPVSQSEGSNETPKVPKKRKTPTDRSEGQSTTPKVTVKRPRRKTNEGMRDNHINPLIDCIVKVIQGQMVIPFA